MNQFNWKNIRSYTNSQNNAFEELVCQLAREEDIPNRKDFIRVGAPDGGVEAYCVLSNGDEYGWQAKFFDTMGDSQWKQLDKSFEVAFEKHPKLIRYYICIPIDRQDPRITNKNYFMDKWNDKVKQWEKYAESNGRTIEFEYWGSSELIERLSQEKHKGRIYFWFSKEEFRNEWFNEQVIINIDNLGTRYTPELNFDLDIAKIFDGLARDGRFKSQFDKVYDDLLKKFRKTEHSMQYESLKEKKIELQNIAQGIMDCYNQINFYEVHTIDYDNLLNRCNRMQNIISLYQKSVKELKESVRETEKLKNNDHNSESDRLNFMLHSLQNLEDSVYGFQQFIESKTAYLSNLPILILNGDAGIGKSHLLADLTKKRIERGQLSILLLGQHFTSEETPWTQILRNLLRVKCNETEFLEALEAKAQSIGYRIIIFIDAINEGKGKSFWKDHIKGFIKSFQKYKWLGLVMSVRSSYEEYLLPYDFITPDIAIRLTHDGFANVEYEASKLFFNNFGIEQPSIPLLHPEFQNPLFLKLFCEGLQKAGLTKIPDGYEGITSILNFYLKTINKRLSDEKRLNYPNEINLIEKSIRLFIQKRLENNLKHIPFEEAFLLFEDEIKRYSDKRRFLNELISEGVFIKNLFWDKHQQALEGIYLAYERFEDHLTASYLLDKYLDKNNPESSFSEGQKLFDLVRDENNCYFNKGIIEALSIQLPELIGKELFEVAQHCKSYYPVIESFVKSLIWRKTDTIDDKLIDYINEYVLKYDDISQQFYETLLLVASNPKHYFNADFLHKNLMRYSLADKDAWWSIFISDKYEKDHSSVKRLIDWAWSEKDKIHISDESIRLTAKAISWFLTSSNRYLRDAATKALISLLENRIPVLIQLLKEFEGVNDPYVYERLYAVAYGCALRTDDKKSLKDLSEYVYHAIFENEYVYPHILLRDYARGVLEYSIYIGIDLKISVDKIRPPYKSDFPKEFPSNQEIKQYEFDYKSKDFKDYYWSLNHIISSMVTEHGRGIGGYGDFGRYIFQRALRNWKNLDPQGLSNLAVKRIFELGYDVDKHGMYDRERTLSFKGYDSYLERIGKKYQWIAFHEILAKVSDNFLMEDEYYNRERKLIQYDGAWEPYVRDIDPTILIKRSGNKKEKNSNYWWDVNFNINWDSEHQEWMNRTDDIPDPSKLILVKDDLGEEWLVLESYPEWSEPDKIGEEKWDNPHKNLWYQIRSYLVLSDKFDTLMDWAKKQNFYGRWMPESHDRYEIYSREFYWSPAFNFFKKPYYDGEVWRTVRDRYNEQNYIGKVLVTSESFVWECIRDCSKEEAISFLKPSETIFQGMRLKFGKIEGELLNQNNQLSCFDPSVNNNTISCLLIRKNDFINFLQESKFDIFWTVIGEKQIVGGYGYEKQYKNIEISGVYFLRDNCITGKCQIDAGN